MDQATSKAIAQLLGPVLLVTTATEYFHGPSLWRDPPVPPSHVYFNGTVLFACGVATVRAHNVWAADWRVLITLAGWGMLAGGLSRMVAPRTMGGGDSKAMWAGVAGLVCAGAILTYKGYAA